MGGKKGLLGALLGIGLAIFLGPGAFGISGLGILTAGQAVMFGISAIGSALMAAKMDKQRKQDDPGFLVNKQSTQEPMYVIYGDREVGGHRIFVDTTDASHPGDPAGTQYLHMAFAIAEGEVANIKEMTDHNILIDNNTGLVTQWREKDAPNGDDDLNFANKIEWAYWLGSDDQYFETPDYFSLAISGGALDGNADMSWAHRDWYNNVDSGSNPGTTEGDSNRRGRGIVWAYMMLTYDRDVFSSAPRVTFEVRGSKVADVVDTTDFDSLTFAQQTARMNNPANCIADYISNKRYGKGLSDANTIDTGTGSTFANYKQYCIDKGITFNGAINTNNTIFDTVQDMMASGNAFMNYSNGVYKIHPNDELDFTSAYTFNKDNILGTVNIELGNKRGMSNIAKGSFFDKDKRYQQDTIVIPKFDETNQYLIDDNNTVSEATFSLNYIHDSSTAEKLTRFQLDNSRFMTTMMFQTTWAASNLEVGDGVYVTYDRYGYTNKKFRLVGQALQADGTVFVTLVEYPTTDIWIADV